ncbi:MAG: peptidylprolyl isomerase [Pseudomonadota bacterium]|nr:peptidylprolyl isomerase [Pseudomonadota bacterium]
MKHTLFAAGAALLLSTTLILPLAAQAQNIAIVNGKAVPKARADALIKQVTAQAAAQNQQLPPDLDQRVRDKLVMDEIFTQEAEKKGLAGTPEYKSQMEAARQTVLTQALLADYVKAHPVSDADVKVEYEKFKAQSAGTEYRARHILVETEDQAKALITQINGGASFDELAKKNSKDPGSGAKGGDLDFAAPSAYVPEFSAAMVKLKKGEMTQEPVKSQFGYHIIKLDDTREAQFPPFDDVKGQLKQRMEQQRLIDYRQEVRSKAKTDYKFSN